MKRATSITTKWLLVATAISLAAACGTVGSKTPPPESDGNGAASDGDSDSDSDSDADGDMAYDTSTGSYDDKEKASSGDTDSDGDSDGDTDTDSDTDGDADFDADTDDGSSEKMGDTAGDTDTATEDENCDPTAQETFYLSADDSNSMASPIIARWQINAGSKVSTAIRIYEFLNYFTFDFPAATVGHVNVIPEMRVASEDEEGEYSLQIGVRAEDRTNEARNNLNITFSLDISGSMSGSPLVRLKKVCNEVAANLKAGDVVSMVSWSSTPVVLLESYAVSGPNDTHLLEVINAISTGGSTNLYNGLKKAYELAAANGSSSSINRVILISDGQANAGIQELDLIAGMAEDSEDETIYLVGVGVGDGYDDTLMDDVTDAGKGAYIFIDTEDEAARMFGDPSRFVASLDIAERDVRASLTLPVGWYVKKFHGEQISTVKSEVEPQHLSPNDAMIYHQLVSTCGDLPVTGSEQILARAEYRDPATNEEKSDQTTATVNDLLSAGSMTLKKGDAIVAYAEALKQTQDLMHSNGNYAQIRDILKAAIDDVQAAATSLADPELEEIVTLLTKYRTKFN